MPTGVYQHKSGYRTNKPRRTAIHVIGPSIAYLPLTRGQFAIIDSEDIERVSLWSWGVTCSPNDSTPYARAAERILETGKTRCFTLHRFLLNFPDIQVDHRNGIGLHCWKGNLRLATSSQNQFNSKKSSRNTSGFKGVCWHPQGWWARISVMGNRKHIGFFKSPSDAAAALAKIRHEYHGEYYNNG